MATSAAPKAAFRVNPILIGISAIVAAVGIAGIAAYYAVPGDGGRTARPPGDTPAAESSPGTTAPRNVLRVEAQQQAMEALFAVARDRQQTGLTTALSDAERKAVGAAVDTVEQPATDPLDRVGLLWMLARTTEGYRFIVAGGGADAAGSYAPVFDAAFWESSGRLAKSGGVEARAFLIELARRLIHPPDRKRMDALLRAQRAMRPPPSPTPPPRTLPSPLPSR